MKIIQKIKKFYAIENEWHTWSERDKLGWTIIIILIILIYITTNV